jgi:hypothetical protein
LVAASSPLANRLVHDHRAPGDIARREDMRRGRAQPLVHLHVPTLVRLHAGPVESQPGGVRYPTDRDHSQRGLDTFLARARRTKQAHAGRTALKAIDRPSVLDDSDAGRGQGGSDRFGDLAVLAHQDAGGDFDKMDA